MTDETVLDGNSEQSGEKGSQPQSSTPQSQPSADVATLQKEVDELKKLYNGIKKSEDKINSRVEQRVSALTSDIGRITELAKAGKSQSEIEERLLLDEIIRERKGSGFPERSEGTEPRGQGPVDVQDIARQLNLDVNDKDIAAAVASGNLVSVMKVAMSKATVPSPGPEDNPPLLGGERPPADLFAMYARLESLSKNATKNKEAIAALTKQIKAAGG